MVKERIKLLFLMIVIALGVDEVVSIAAECSKQYIHDSWVFGQARMSRRYPARVPGVVHLDLLDNGLIEDPFLEMNERSVQWVDKEDWVYETSFTPEQEIFSREHIMINFDGLDTYADVYLNDTKILTSDNMFRRWEVDIKSYLRSGSNTLRVYLHSPIKIDMPKWESLPFQYRASNDQSENGGLFDRKLSIFARKAGYHYGWDWGPRLVTSGIWRDVYLSAWDDVRISSVYFQQNKVDKAKAEITNTVCLDSDRDIEGAEITICDEQSGKILYSGKSNLKKGTNKLRLDFVINNPRLWWCNGMGSAELYRLKTSIRSGNSELAFKSERIGVRSIKVISEPDESGNMQFYFVLNGQSVFAKGSNYIPQDNFLPRVTAERHRKTIQDAVEANMNMIRIWGGGIYEDDVFYDICDELGIMVWQDFMFACSVYPVEGAYAESVREEAVDNVCRLRNHPCIALWCGGNECLDAWYNWGWKNKYEEQNTEYARIIESQADYLYFDLLPSVVSEYDPQTPYWANSPFSGRYQGSDGLNGDFHFYGVWRRKLPIDTYNHLRAHFFSEYGVQSFPEYSTICKFASDSSDHRLDSDVISSHQRGGDVANELIAWYLENEYRPAADFKEFIYLSQLYQADAMRTAIEAHRRERPYCMGSLLWQHNDCWPVASWSTRDYYGHWKAAHYLIRKAFAPMTPSISRQGDTLRVHVLSDRLYKSKGEMQLKVYTLDGRLVNALSSKVNIPANASQCVTEMSLRKILKGADIHDVVINISISEKGHEAISSNFFLCKQKDLNYPKADFSYECTEVEEGFELSLSSSNFVRAVSLALDEEQVIGNDVSRFDDNFFDLLPGEVKHCTIKVEMSLEEFKNRLKVISYN